MQTERARQNTIHSRLYIAAPPYLGARLFVRGRFLEVCGWRIEAGGEEGGGVGGVQSVLRFLVGI